MQVHGVRDDGAYALHIGDGQLVVLKGAYATKPLADTDLPPGPWLETPVDLDARRALAAQLDRAILQPVAFFVRPLVPVTTTPTFDADTAVLLDNPGGVNQYGGPYNGEGGGGGGHGGGGSDADAESFYRTGVHPGGERSGTTEEHARGAAIAHAKDSASKSYDGPTHALAPNAGIAGSTTKGQYDEAKSAQFDKDYKEQSEAVHAALPDDSKATLSAVHAVTGREVKPDTMRVVGNKVGYTQNGARGGTKDIRAFIAKTDAHMAEKGFKKISGEGREHIWTKGNNDQIVKAQVRGSGKGQDVLFDVVVKRK